MAQEGEGVCEVDVLIHRLIVVAEGRIAANLDEEIVIHARVPKVVHDRRENQRELLNRRQCVV